MMLSLEFTLSARAGMRTLAALTLGLSLLALSPAALAAWDLQQLMDTLAQNKSGQTTFVEKKYIAMLDKPVESSGELVFTAPDGLEKRTLKPKPESMLIKGGELFIERGNQKHRLQLQAYPELAAFIDSIRGTLAGDRKALDRLRAMADKGSAYALVNGAGENFGAWVIENIEETGTLFVREGVPRRVEFTINIARVDDELADPAGGTDGGGDWGDWWTGDDWDWWL